MTTALAPRPVEVPGKGLLLVEPTANPSLVLVHSQNPKHPEPYEVTQNRNGFVCNCHDFTYNRKGECKHTRAAQILRSEEQMTSDLDYSSVDGPYPHPTAALYAALAKAQSEVRPASKDATGQIGSKPGYRYANLGDVDNAIRDALSENGLAVIQFPGVYRDGCQHVKNVVVHKDGGSIEHEMSIPCKGDAQGAGSGLTYARRYALLGIMRVITEDDDGSGAMPPQQQSNQRNNSAPRPAQEPTGGNGEMARVERVQRAFEGRPPVAQGQLSGVNLATVKSLIQNTQFPSLGMVGAFIAGEGATFVGLTESLVEAWADNNPGASGEELLMAAGAWYESQPDVPDQWRAKARKWREAQS